MSHMPPEIKMEDPSNNSDSDAELEAAIQVEPDLDPIPGPSSFKPPPNPSIPQDLSLIMEMVSRNEVVGSLPSVSMSAAEKRKLVEDSMKGKGKGKEKEVLQEVEEEEDSDSDSSSEFVTSSEDESDHEEKKNHVPMNEDQHKELKEQLDEFVNSSIGTGTANEVEVDSDSEDDDDEGDESYGNLHTMGFEFMEDSEDDGPTAGPITSIHEAPLPAVAQPPLVKLPEGEGVSLAGEVVSWMRERKVEVWLEKRRVEEEQSREDGKVDQVQQIQGEGQSMATGGSLLEVNEQVKVGSLDEDTGAVGRESNHEGEVAEETTVTNTISTVPEQSVEEEKSKPVLSPAKPKAPEPKFTSSGTVVVRAMQSRPGAADEGWLEEGSVLCWEDGRVLGTVHETFGPLTSPFYTIRLPPPPFPYPSPESLIPGARLFYPLNPSYRSFVNMLTIRDPRFKGSDASNLYDEEIAEDEMEWSDDEMEAQAKRRRKQRKGSKAPSNNRGRGGVHGIAGLPVRPHFDYDHDASEVGSLHGDGDGEENWETGSNFSMGSMRSRKEPEPYDIDEPSPVHPSGDRNTRGGRGQERGRGRGQGRDRGRGRGGGAGGRGNARREANSSHQSNNARQGFELPQNPMMAQQQYHQQQQQYYPQQHQQHYPYQQNMNFPQSQFPQQQPYQPYQQMQFPQAQAQHHDAYEPNQPSTGMPTYPQYQQGYPQHQQQRFIPSGMQGVPAINPRFAAQYAQMMNNQAATQNQAYGWQG
ncbi:hypothetical protein I302_108701 [Kwoniella bestiolae CBS 10118]|uniref:H/ACA ribonucleoprotein complex non-core subunit NAF1 n=1 Tax=Kwoniella bestiolae CBS 10118 TaxID=1296100 RepID=A0A1B9FTV4_9TREE|nr:hypothetical protein I302_07837 [Kwoniella bestiolae CBS 10118]OCF22192.1 hypothetical protein I302_07837 [Kwoniella bestiolae CBS 10118]